MGIHTWYLCFRHWLFDYHYKTDKWKGFKAIGIFLVFLTVLATFHPSYDMRKSLFKIVFIYMSLFMLMMAQWFVIWLNQKVDYDIYQDKWKRGLIKNGK